MLYTLYKLSGGENIRTEYMVGHIQDPPEKGKRFVICGEALDPSKNIRIVTTSMVTEVKYLNDDRGYIFSTESGSQYILSIVSNPE